MRDTMKTGVLLFVMLLFALAGPTLASGGTADRPNTGINTDAPFPVGVDPICGVRVTVYGSEPVNFYTGTRNPWGPPTIAADPLHPGYWTVTFGDPVSGPCFSRNDPIFKECGVFKGLHFGFYTDDPVVNYLNPSSSVWSSVGPPCVYFGPHGEVPCSGLTSHSVSGFGQIAILNANVSASASTAAIATTRVRIKAGAGAEGLSIRNVRIAVAPDVVPINSLGPCALQNLAWQNVQLADSVLPPSTPESGVGTLDVTIPDNILSQQGWAVMVYDVVDPATGNLLTTSTLDFPLNP